MMSKKNLVKREFELDEQKRSYEKIISDRESGIVVTDEAFYGARNMLPDIVAELRHIQANLYGWRSVKKVYGKGRINKLNEVRRRVSDLENLEILYKTTISNYGRDRRTQERAVSELQARLGDRMGKQPGLKEVEAAQEKLLEVHRKAGLAELGLPEVEENLKEARSELEKAEKEKKSFTDPGGKIYSTPQDELHAMACAYADGHGCTYGVAVEAILGESDELAMAYIDAGLTVYDDE
jgi:DNA repair exonuclease SbcCD ATPase subunit